MRAHKRKRDQIRAFMTPKPSSDVLEAIAERAHYEGSQEHKSHPSFAGPPGLRLRPENDATPCDPIFAGKQELLTSWLREAIRDGQISGYWEGDFPRYAWLLKDGVVYEARLVNRVLGSYKGYALKSHEYPRELK